MAETARHLPQTCSTAGESSLCRRSRSRGRPGCHTGTLSRYRSQLEEIGGLGAEILIPVQNGELSPAEFYRRAVEASGLALVPAMPMKKAATGFDGVLAFVR